MRAAMETGRIHELVCPGRILAALQNRTIMQAKLARGGREQAEMQGRLRSGILHRIRKDVADFAVSSECGG